MEKKDKKKPRDSDRSLLIYKHLVYGNLPGLSDMIER